MNDTKVLTGDLKELVNTIIKYHETDDFEALSRLISETEIKSGVWFNKKQFLKVCEAIAKDLGEITSLEFIRTLNRKSSFLTLWKSTYTKSEDEVLWQITFDRDNNKITLMHINWEIIKE